MSNNAEQIRQQRIHNAKRTLEDGTNIKEGKIAEWALLDIAENLYGILYQMMRQGAHPLRGANVGQEQGAGEPALYLCTWGSAPAFAGHECSSGKNKSVAIGLLKSFAHSSAVACDPCAALPITSLPQCGHLPITRKTLQLVSSVISLCRFTKRSGVRL
jgi:hypothetical protein